MLKITSYGEVREFKAARTILGRPLYLTHFFFLKGLLIDTGPPCVSQEVINTLKEYDIKKVAITHQHEDHTGNCSLIQKELGVPIYAHPGTIHFLADPPKNIQLYRKIMWGNAPHAEAGPLDNYITAGDYSLDVIHTGGHSKDHVCFFEPQNRGLFAGDIYLGEKLTSFMDGEDIVEHLTGLQKLISLEPKFLFCGLKGRLKDGKQRLVNKYNSWWNLCCRVKELHDAGKSRSEIMAEVFDRETLFYYFSQSNWGRRHMLDSIIENLDYFETGHKKESLTGYGQFKQ